MTRSLYLLDGMALIYRAHFALIKSPIFTSSGVNTSALYGFMNTVLDLVEQRKPDFLAIALDTPEPTERHRKFPAYKAHRDEIPEDIAAALPHIDRIAAALRIPLLRYPGHEADDVIGTLAVQHASPGLEVMMVTPDKDFAQLVRPHISMFKPGRQGNDVEILGPAEVMTKWEVADPLHVIDVLGLWGDASDNIPGVPGFGEKTAKKLIGQYGSIEGIYDHLDEIKGKQREKLEQFKEQAFLSRDLVTINLAVPVKESLDDLARREADHEALQQLLIEFEFNSIGRRIYGPDFKAGRGYSTAAAKPAASSPAQGELFASTEQAAPPPVSVQLQLTTLDDVPHHYTLIDDDKAAQRLAGELAAQPRFCFDLETDQLDPKIARIAGLAFCWEKGTANYVRLPVDDELNRRRLAIFSEVLGRDDIGKTGQNLKFDIAVLAWNGIEVRGPLFDTMIAHALLEPERRHGMDALAEQYLGYSPIPITRLIGEKKSSQITMFEVEPRLAADYAAEDADVTWQLAEVFAPMLKEQGLDQVFHDIEMPLLPALVAMEREGIALDESALQTASAQLGASMLELEKRIFELAGTSFNLNSPRQLGEILFDKLSLVDKAKKTRTGQYATDEKVLSELAGEHEIARLILEYREASKLKSTYVDALPQSVFAGTGRIHTTFSQTGAVTGRLASSNPNLQNIPIRSAMGQQIRAAFIAPDDEHRLLAADYSQIELRVMAEVSGDPSLRDAFARGLDIHTATAARVYQVALEDVTSDMRRKAKMVNFGIIYGISAFGLAQRLTIPRAEAASIIQHYFEQYPGVKDYMDRTIATCRDKGYVETLSGRRRWIRDINSANNTIRNAAERTAINTPIQGTAADMIKIAMARIQAGLRTAGLRTVMVLQVHDELVFNLLMSEKDIVMPMVVDAMKQALPLEVPVEVETGIGHTWLEAH
ncbi:MAG: DNA polymerase I [Kiritimatiellia bacterium]